MVEEASQVARQSRGPKKPGFIGRSRQVASTGALPSALALHRLRLLLGPRHHLVESLHVELIHVDLHLLVAAILHSRHARSLHQADHLVQVCQGQLRAQVVELFFLKEGRPARSVGDGPTWVDRGQVGDEREAPIKGLPEDGGDNPEPAEMNGRAAWEGVRVSARAWLLSAHGSGRVVRDRVLPDEPDVTRVVLGRHVVIALELLANRPKILRLFDHLQVVGQPHVLVVDRLSEPLRERVQRHVVEENPAALHRVQLGVIDLLGLALDFLQLLLESVAQSLSGLEVHGLGAVEQESVFLRRVGRRSGGQL